MRSFTFYINIDHCLNMFYYDIFFYKMLSEKYLHISEVELNKNEGEYSLKQAFHGIRNYLDRSPYSVQDYSIVLGLRVNGDAAPAWEESVLHRMLNIYYSLKTADIYLQTRDQVDRNLSIIVLYESAMPYETTHDTAYDTAKDIKLLLDSLEIDLEKGTDFHYISSALRKYIDNKLVDGITSTFLQDYIDSLSIEPLTTKHTVKSDDSNSDDAEWIGDDQLNSYDFLDSLLLFVEKRIGHYLILCREVNINSLADQQLALLSVVDFISADDKRISVNEPYLNGNRLRFQNDQKWEAVKDFGEIQIRYGTMLNEYCHRLKAIMYVIDQNNNRGAERIPEYGQPLVLEVKDSFPDQLRSHKVQLQKKLNFFAWSFWGNSAELSRLQESSQKLKGRLDVMEDELKRYAEELCDAYQEQLRNRRKDQSQNNGQYDLKAITSALTKYEDKKRKVLDKLKEPSMNLSLDFQNQLNLERSLTQFSSEMKLYQKFKSVITVRNFLSLIFGVGGIFTLQYLMAQYYVLADLTNLAFLTYLGFIGVIFLMCWGAPELYFRKRLRQSQRALRRDLDEYMKGYVSKAENFRIYINSLNELDAANQVIDQLKRCKIQQEERSRKYSWHKTQIQRHLDKANYFASLMQSVNDKEIIYSDHLPELDPDEDVIFNQLYWPQGR